MMGENQCPHCGHIKTGFEHQDFLVKQSKVAVLEAENATLRGIVEQLRLALTIQQPDQNPN